MKVNQTRDCETMQAQGYFEAGYTKDMPQVDGCCYEQNEMMGETMPGVVCPPVYEAPRETVCHRYICHEVPHVMLKSETFNTHIDTKWLIYRFFNAI